MKDDDEDLRLGLKALQIQDPLKDLRLGLKALQIQDPLKDLRLGLKALQIQDPLRDLRLGLKALQIQDPLKDLHLGLKVLRVQDPLKDLRAVLSSISYGHKAQDPSPEGQNNQEGDGFAAGIDPQEFVGRLDQIAAHAREAPSDIAKALSAVIAEIRDLKDTRAQQIIYYLLLPLLINLCTSIVQPIVGFYLERHLGADEKKMVRVVEHVVVQAAYRAEDLDGLRIVRAPGAQVRSGRKGRSAVVASLKPGQVVFVLQKRRRWSLVGFSDEERNLEGYGWVRSKRLKSLGLRGRQPW